MSKLPPKVKFDFVFIVKNCQYSIKFKNEFKNAKVEICNNLQDCIINAVMKCKLNDTRIGMFLEQEIGHIVPKVVSGETIGYAVSLLGAEIKLCVPKEVTKKLVEMPETISLRQIDENNLSKLAQEVA